MPGDKTKTVELSLLEPPLEEPVTLTLALLVADGPGRIGPKAFSTILAQTPFQVYRVIEKESTPQIYFL